jgi:hypothetical protein
MSRDVVLTRCCGPAPQGEAWWARQDSNLQPDRYERPALTIELQAPPQDGSRESAAGNGARFVYRDGGGGAMLGLRDGNPGAAMLEIFEYPKLAMMPL